MTDIVCHHCGDPIPDGAASWSPDIEKAGLAVDAMRHFHTADHQPDQPACDDAFLERVGVE